MVVGDMIEYVIKKVWELNEKGFVCMFDYLGEFVLSKEEVIEVI